MRLLLPSLSGCVIGGSELSRPASSYVKQAGVSRLGLPVVVFPVRRCVEFSLSSDVTGFSVMGKLTSSCFLLIPRPILGKTP